MALLMPISAQIHYKCAFDVEKDEFINNEIRQIIRNWCSNRRDFKENVNDSIFNNWFYVGDSDQHCFGNCHIRIACNYGIYEKHNPEHWCFELVHYDTEFPCRLWAVTISTTRTSPCSVRIACVVSHALRHNYIGSEPSPPIPTVPRFIKDIISKDRFSCKKSISDILYRHIDAGVVGGRWLANSVCNEERFLPNIILVHIEDIWSGDDFATEIQQKNIGNVNVYTITDYDTLKEFNENVPFDYRVSDGMVRVFFKYKKQSGSGKFHRFYTASQIAERNVEIVNEITIALSRRALTFLPNEVVSIKDIIDKRRMNYLEKLKNNDDFDKDKYISVLENELDEKIKEISEKEEMHRMAESSLEDSLIETQIELEAAIEDKKRLSWEASQFACSIERIKELEYKIANNSIFFDMPTTLVDVLNNAKSLYGELIEFHENSYKSARACKFKNDQKILNEAWKIFSSLAQYMHPAKFCENAGDLEKIFYEKTGIKFSMTESAATKSDSKFVKLRKCEHDGTEVYFFPHIKSSIRSEFRVHFVFLEHPKKILICHCGHHIDNARTRHMS